MGRLELSFRRIRATRRQPLLREGMGRLEA